MNVSLCGLVPPGQEGQSAPSRNGPSTLAAQTGWLFKLEKINSLNHHPASQFEVAARHFLDLLGPPLLARRGKNLTPENDTPSPGAEEGNKRRLLVSCGQVIDETSDSAGNVPDCRAF